MTAIEDFPLPATSRHDENGNHIPPHIPNWRRNQGTDRTVLGSEVKANERRQAVFAAHLREHLRRGESAGVVNEFNGEVI